MSRPYKKSIQAILLLYYGLSITTLWGDKLSMLPHTCIYPHKPWGKIEVTIFKITRLTAHFMCGLMSDSADLQVAYFFL